MSPESEGPIRSHVRPSKFPIRFLMVAIVMFTASVTWSIVHHANAPAADPGTLSVVEECKQALGYDARTAADIEWLNQCVSALTPPTTATTPPTESPSPTTSPSTTPTASASPTGTPTTSPSATPTPPPTSTAPPTTTVPPSSTPPPTSPSSTPSSTGCPVSGSNKPGAADPWGGCWPGPGNSGVPAGISLTPYTGSCTITVANTVIDSKTITCSSLLIKATNVVIKNSLLQNVDLDNGSIPTNSSFMIMDSTVVNGAREQCGCVAGHNFVAARIEVRGGNRSAYCINTCSITDSWLHAQQLQGSQHGSGIREEINGTIRHNAFACDFPTTDDATGLGCSAALTGYPDFAPIHNNTVDRNLFLASTHAAYCAYGGNTQGKTFSTDPANATNQKFTNNVFQRGAPGPTSGKAQCADFGPITDFSTTRSGNVWSGNVWDNGGVVPPG